MKNTRRMTQISEKQLPNQTSIHQHLKLTRLKVLKITLTWTKKPNNKCNSQTIFKIMEWIALQGIDLVVCSSRSIASNLILSKSIFKLPIICRTSKKWKLRLNLWNEDSTIISTKDNCLLQLLKRDRRWIYLTPHSTTRVAIETLFNKVLSNSRPLKICKVRWEVNRYHRLFKIEKWLCLKSLSLNQNQEYFNCSIRELLITPNYYLEEIVKLWMFQSHSNTIWGLQLVNQKS